MKLLRDVKKNRFVTVLKRCIPLPDDLTKAEPLLSGNNLDSAISNIQIFTHAEQVMVNV